MEKDLCNSCKNYLGNLKCLAFPNGIPDDVLTGSNNHDTVISGQSGEYVYLNKSESNEESFMDQFKIKKGV